MVGSPPAMEIIGAPDSSAALMASSTGIILLITALYSRMRPQPTQERLHISSGSNIVTRGKRLRPFNFWPSTYEARRKESSIGLLEGLIAAVPRDFLSSVTTATVSP